MFTLVIKENETVEKTNIREYNFAVSEFFISLGHSILLEETKTFILELNGYKIREIEIVKGKVVKDFAKGC